MEENNNVYYNFKLYEKILKFSNFSKLYFSNLFNI